MTVLERRIVHDLAIDAARGDHRHLGLEGDELLDDRLLVTDRRPDVLDIRRRRHLVLTLAVVAEGRRLDDRGRADARDRVPQFVERRRAAERRRRKSAVRQKLLFPRALLRHVQRHAARPDRRDRLDGVDGIVGHVLELEGHHSTCRANARSASRSSYSAHDFDVGDLSGRRIVSGENVWTR